MRVGVRVHAFRRKLMVLSRNTLCDPEVIRYINTNTLFWACNVKSGEGYKVAEALKSGSYPFLALIVLKDNRMTIVGRYVRLNAAISQDVYVVLDLYAVHHETFRFSLQHGRSTVIR